VEGEPLGHRDAERGSGFRSGSRFGRPERRIRGGGWRGSRRRSALEARFGQLFLQGRIIAGVAPENVGAQSPPDVDPAGSAQTSITSSSFFSRRRSMASI
jgi:hypothetical protein